LLFLSVSYSFAQSIPDTIKVRKAFGAYHFSMNKKTLKPGQMARMMESNEPAYNLMRSAQANNTIATIFECAGGFLIGWPLGAAIARRDADWRLAGAGLGLIAISIPFTIKFNRRAIRSVELYNGFIHARASKYTPVLGAFSGKSGIGLALDF